MGNGTDAPDGVYQISLAAFNDKGEAVLSDQVVDATVTGVVNDNGTVYLGMDGGQLMALANVRQVTTPKVKESSSDKDESEDKGEEESKDEEKAEESEKTEGSNDTGAEESGSDATDEAEAA